MQELTICSLVEASGAVEMSAMIPWYRALCSDGGGILAVGVVLAVINFGSLGGIF